MLWLMRFINIGVAMVIYARTQDYLSSFLSVAVGGFLIGFMKKPMGWTHD
jgi:hypothetical protein